MMRFTRGNILEADVEAVVNTVNEVGVMGKGIALMFKEAFPANFALYAKACREGRVQVGRMFVTQTQELLGPKWIVNFPTKKHWRSPTKIEWLLDGLDNLREVIKREGIKSIAIPPLGCGNGGLEWVDVRAAIEQTLSSIPDVEVVVYEPTGRYQNVAKRSGVKKLTPARALVAETIRRYLVLGMECSLLEIHKLAWFLERAIVDLNLDNPLDLRFKPDRFGPYANRLQHLLNAMDGSYLHSDKRIPDADPLDAIHFNEEHRDYVAAYLRTGEGKPYEPALERTSAVIDGFESPLGMELLATVDWLMIKEGCGPTLGEIRSGIDGWPAGEEAASRKAALFDDYMIELALERLIG